jgi:predicted P-loop ATPase/GTPase
MPDTNYLKLKINLIRRMNFIQPKSRSAAYNILMGTTNITDEIIEYALNNNYNDIIQDLSDTAAPKHQLAIEFDNLQINLGK